jgi:hypothetical protein
MSSGKEKKKVGRPKDILKPLPNQPLLSFSKNACGKSSLTIGAPASHTMATPMAKSPPVKKKKDLPPLTDVQEDIVKKMLPQRGRQMDAKSRNGVKMLWLSLGKNSALLMRHLQELPIWENRNLSKRAVYKMLKRFQNPSSKKCGVQVPFYLFSNYYKVLYIKIPCVTEFFYVLSNQYLIQRVLFLFMN